MLTAAAAVRAAVLVDERKARLLIDRDPTLRDAIPLATGTIGLIVLAKRRGRIAAVRPLLDALRRQNFWIAPAFYADIIRQAGEG